MSEHRAGHVRVRSYNITGSVVEEIALVEESLISDVSRTCQIVERNPYGFSMRTDISQPLFDGVSTTS